MYDSMFDTICGDSFKKLSQTSKMIYQTEYVKFCVFFFFLNIINYINTAKKKYEYIFYFFLSLILPLFVKGGSDKQLWKEGNTFTNILGITRSVT